MIFCRMSPISLWSPRSLIFFQLPIAAIFIWTPGWREYSWLRKLPFAVEQCSTFQCGLLVLTKGGQVQYHGICASLAYKERVTWTHSNMKRMVRLSYLFHRTEIHFWKSRRPIFSVLLPEYILVLLLLSLLASLLPALFFFSYCQSSSLLKGKKHQALKMGKKNATTLETKFNITRQFITDTGFYVKANLNMTWCP